MVAPKHLLTGHHDTVLCLALADVGPPQQQQEEVGQQVGQVLFSGGQDGRLRAWDTARMASIGEVAAHRGSVSALALIVTARTVKYERVPHIFADDRRTRRIFSLSLRYDSAKGAGADHLANQECSFDNHSSNQECSFVG